MGGVSWEDSENIKADQCLWWYNMWDIMEEHGDIMIQRHDGIFSWECNGDIIGFFNKPSEYPLVN